MILVFGIILLIGLCTLSWIDARTYRLPNFITMPLIPIGFIQSIYVYNTPLQSLIGAVVGYSVFVMIEHGYKALRGRDGLGRGDAKLLAVGGAWCGWAGLPFIILIGSGAGLLAILFPSFRNYADNAPIPFGPFLAFAIACVWCAQTYVLLTPLTGG